MVVAVSPRLTAPRGSASRGETGKAGREPSLIADGKNAFGAVAEGSFPQQNKVDQPGREPDKEDGHVRFHVPPKRVLLDDRHHPGRPTGQDDEAVDGETPAGEGPPDDRLVIV